MKKKQRIEKKKSSINEAKKVLDDKLASVEIDIAIIDALLKFLQNECPGEYDIGKEIVESWASRLLGSCKIITD